MSIEQQNNRRTYKLFKAVIDASVADDFKEATDEWKVLGYEELEDETCVCGKLHIVRCYRIKNRCTDIELWPIGSECIKKFEQPDMDKDAHDLQLAEARRTRAALVAAKKEVVRLEQAERERSERILSTQREEAQRIVNEQKKKEARETMARRAEESRIAQQRATEGRLVTFGKYTGKSFKYVSDKMPWYVEYIRENAKRDEFADLVRFHDSRN